MEDLHAHPVRETGGALPAWRMRLDRVCRAVALFGGAALCATMGVTLASVVGAQFGHPILGDTEIVDQLTGVLVFCCLPWCHLHGGNVMVDFFTRPLPRRVNRRLDAVANLAFAVVAGVLAWRLIAGGIAAHARDQRSMFLSLPDWPVYALGSATAVLWIVVILFVAWESALDSGRASSGPEPAAHTFG
jgi:TRAP-type C4-dicarboxylate transport system permease small subunit